LNLPNEDPLYHILRSKRESTRFQILVGVAEHQPAVRQQEIAEQLRLTPQAISEYIRELTEDGMVVSNGRGRYQVTPEGIECIIESAQALDSYIQHITNDVIRPVSIWAAIAGEQLEKGDEVGVYMKDGLLYAGKEVQSAMAIVSDTARRGEDVGICQMKGIIDVAPGKVHIFRVPKIEHGGSRQVPTGALRGVLGKVKFVGCVGVEALVAVRKNGREPDVYFGAREGVIEAARFGMDAALVIEENEVSPMIQRIEGAGLQYVLHDRESA